MFQQFNPSIRSTLHRVTFAFVDWQYHTRFPVVRETITITIYNTTQTVNVSNYQESSKSVITLQT